MRDVLVALLAALAAGEFGRRCVAGGTGHRLANAVAAAAGAGVAAAYGSVWLVLLLPRALEPRLGAAPTLVGVWAAAGLAAGLLIVIVADRLGTRRGSATALALAAVVGGAIAMALATSVVSVSVAAIVAGAGGGGAIVLLKAEARLALAGEGTATALGLVNTVAWSTLFALLVVGGMLAAAGRPELSLGMLAALGLAALWALAPLLWARRRARVATASWRRSANGSRVLRAVAIATVNVGAAIVLQAKTVDLIAAHAIPPALGGAGFAGLLLVGCVSRPWGRRIDADPVRAERAATGATAAFAVVGLAGVAATAYTDWGLLPILVAWFGIDVATSLTNAVAEKPAVEAAGEVGPNALLTLIRFGFGRTLYVWLGVSAWTSATAASAATPVDRLASGEGRLWLLSIVLALAAWLLARSDLGIGRAPNRAANAGAAAGQAVRWLPADEPARS